MTIKECIDIVDNLKPNQYTIKDKVMWLSFIEHIIINEVLKTHEGYDGRYDDFEGYSEDKISVTLIVPSPYDRLYTAFITMKIDELNGETLRYNNSAILYNSYMTEYRKFYNKTHMPLDATSHRAKPKPPINVNNGLTDAEYDKLVKDMTYILTEYFSDAVAPDKIDAIVRNYVSANAQMLKGKDGKNGSNGKDGYTPVKGIDYTDGKDGKPFTFNDLTPEQLILLKGEKGEKGDKGDQGVRGLQGIPGEKGDKGEDGHVTEEDKAEIINDVLTSKEFNKIEEQVHNMIPEIDSLWNFVNTHDSDISYLMEQVGNIDSALDNIIEIQNSLIGGDA